MNHTEPPIIDSLSAIERDEGCRILYCCESGSRAWGFASPDSDWDVRFIYVMPRDWYIQVGQPEDQLDWMLPGDLDVKGWELRKTLRLFATCNLGLNEWIGSPIIYRDQAGLRKALSDLLPSFFNSRKGIHHYGAIATRSLEHLGSDGRIAIKKLFYILRPLMAACWIAERRTMPPTSFHELRRASLAPPLIESIIDDLLRRKESAIEKEPIVLPDELRQWIEQTRSKLNSIAEAAPTVGGDRPRDELDALLRRFVV